MPQVEQTFGLIKPDAVEAGLASEMMDYIESWGLRILGFHQRGLQQCEARWLYLQHRCKPFFRPLVNFITSGPTVLMALEGEAAVEVFRLMALHRLRPKYATDFRRNAVHASDSVLQAGRELSLFFPELAMGIDGFIFDCVSMHCSYFNKLTNLKGFDRGLDNSTLKIFDRLRNPVEWKEGATVTSAEVVKLMDVCMAAWQQEEGKGTRWYWCAKVRRFADLRPQGRFFVVTDHDEPDSWHVRYTGSYLTVDDPLT